MSLLDFQSREVVHVKVKLCNGSGDALYKKFSIDPGITTFEVLQRLLARAFDIRGDFTIAYLVTDDIGEKVYLSMLSDWDLDAAILSASDPMLRLKITMRSFDNGMEKDWDIISRGELPLQSQAGLLAMHRQQLQQQQQQRSSTALVSTNGGTTSVVAPSAAAPSAAASSAAVASSTSTGSGGGAGQFFSQLGSHVGKSMFSQVQKAVGGWRLLPDGLNLPATASAFSLAAAASGAPPRSPVSDREFQSHLDSAGRVRDFWALKQAVFLGGLDPSLRKVAWRLLLPVFPKGSTGQERMSFMKRSGQRYADMKRRWKQVYAAGKMSQGHLSVITAISKDVIRTDREQRYFAYPVVHNPSQLGHLHLMSLLRGGYCGPPRSNDKDSDCSSNKDSGAAAAASADAVEDVSSVACDCCYCCCSTGDAQRCVEVQSPDSGLSSRHSSGHAAAASSATATAAAIATAAADGATCK